MSRGWIISGKSLGFDSGEAPAFRQRNATNIESGARHAHTRAGRCGRLSLISDVPDRRGPPLLVPRRISLESI
jgi:hypothetical protein